MKAYILVCLVDLFIPQSQSLKDKRQHLRSIIDRVRARKADYNLSISELGLNDCWQRSVLGVSGVSNDAAHLEQAMERFIRIVENDPGIEISNIKRELYSLPFDGV
jgi:uncharacterized protein